MIKSSNGSSGRTVVRFSCKIPIFFSLSHPDGLKTKGWCDKRVQYFHLFSCLLCYNIWKKMAVHIICHKY